MAHIKGYLEKNTLEDFAKKYQIKVSFHEKLPLIILNYRNWCPKNNPYGSVCRGLVLELNTWDIVSQGMVRFFDLKSNKTAIVQAQIKEDGTLLHLFNYKGSWLLSTRHNFGEDFLSHERKLTYVQLFEDICKMTIQEVGSKLNSDITYCIEMCSGYNRIIRFYSQPTIFLLTSYQGGMEMSDDFSDGEALIMNWNRPRRHNVGSTLECQKLLESYIEIDPLFEGFVVKDFVGNRYKIKNKFYLQIHKLKYRGWKTVLPENIVPLILNHRDKINLIYDALHHNHRDYDVTEYVKRFDYYNTKITEILMLDPAASEFTIIENLSQVDPFIDHQHSKKYCINHIAQHFNDGELSKNDGELSKNDGELSKNDDGLSKNDGELSKNDNGLSKNDNGLSKSVPTCTNEKWNVQCYCGANMYLHRTKTDHLIYKMCVACNSNFDTLTYPTGSLIWLCEKCSLTHDAHQNDYKFDNIVINAGQPTGIPCSSVCKNLRLTLHQILSDIKEKNKCSRSDVYQILSDCLKIPKESAHMALFDIPMCMKAIELLKENLS